MARADWVCVKEGTPLREECPLHPNLVRLHDIFEDSEAFLLVTDFYAGERLKKIGRFNEREAARACHTYRVMIRDLKPKNMAFVEADEASTLKIINFETSILFKPGEKFNNEIAGALLYSAPEVIAKNYGKESDMWSAGIIMYEMLYGKHPFHYDGMRTSEFKKAVCEDRVNFFTYPWPHVIVSDPAMDLIERMLRRDPSSRISVDGRRGGSLVIVSITHKHQSSSAMSSTIFPSLTTFFSGGGHHSPPHPTISPQPTITLTKKASRP
ncbi:putative protein kinase CAMK-CDPK family [Helianthus anomalus]